MSIGLITLHLFIPSSRSLKDKRSVVKSLLTRLHDHYNLSCAELADQDKWQVAVIGCAGIAANKTLLEPHLHHAVNWVASQQGNFELTQHSIEFL